MYSNRWMGRLVSGVIVTWAAETRMYLALYILILVDTDISVVAGSLELTSSPATATDDELFTMTCTGSQGGSRIWSRDGVDAVFRTQPEKSELQLISPSLTGDLVGRVNVSGSDDGTQHNVTLLINSRIDNGGVWRCIVNVRNYTSNTLTITTAVTLSTTALVTTSTQTTLTGSSLSDPTAESRMSSSTAMFSTTSSETPPPTSSSSSLTYVIVTVAVSAVVSIAVVVVILIVLRNRRIQSRKDRQDSSIYATPSAYEDMNNLYCELRTNHGLTEDETTLSSYAISTYHTKEEAILANNQNEATLSCYVNTG